MAKKDTITIELPVDIFDTDAATVQRKRRISVGAVDNLKALKSDDPMPLYRELARFYPRWDGVFDCETGEPLDNPETDPAVFARLDISEQFSWFLGPGLRARPTQA